MDFNDNFQRLSSKTTVSKRKGFTNLEENMFISLLKTDMYLVALEKGELDKDDSVKGIIKTM